MSDDVGVIFLELEILKVKKIFVNNCLKADYYFTSRQNDLDYFRKRMNYV